MQKRRGELCAGARALAAGPLAARDRELATNLRNIAAGCPGEAAPAGSAPR